MKHRIFFWSLTSALAGFLFGFDTVVISGAEQTIQKLWSLSDAMHGLVMGSALYGTVIGALLGGWPTDRFGRRPTLLWIGVLYFISAVWSGMATDEWTLSIARFLGGLGVGAATVAAPLYIAEISPPESRGRLAGMFQFNIVFGILVAFLSNYLIGRVAEPSVAWRWMLGVEAIPALIYSVLCFGIPESPRWLITRKGDRAAGVAVLRMIRSDASQGEAEALAERIHNASVEPHARGGFWTWRLRVPILLAFLVAFFNQLSGINAILYFAPRIFGLTGSGPEEALRQSIGIGITNLIFTFVGLWLIDRIGRRSLLYIGSFGYILSLGLCAWAFIHWAPQFKVAASAWEVLGVAQKLQAPDLPNRTEVEDSLATAVNGLAAASADARYLPGAVKIPTDAAPATVESQARAALSAASESAGGGGTMVLLCIFAFIAAHAVGQGAVIWVLISEIFPNRHRAEGQALGSFTHWIFAALLTTFFPKMVTAFAPGAVFAFFCFMMVLQLIWVKFYVPETKGVPLEQMQKKLGIN